jgi:hypothetical protein
LLFPESIRIIRAGKPIARSSVQGTRQQNFPVWGLGGLTTTDQKSAAPIGATMAPQAVAPASPIAAGPIKNASTPIASTPTADTTANEGKSDAGVFSAVKAEKRPKRRRK